jgi:hypothetical protein
MISNERPSLTAQQSDFQRRLPIRENSLLHKRTGIGRRSYAFALNENTYGRFLRITESADNRINSIIVPDIGMEPFRKLMDEMVTALRQEPPLLISETGELSGLSVYERTLKTGGFDIDWKSFLFVLIEDYRGRYLHITEKTTGGRHSSLIILADGLETFQKLVTEIAVALSAWPSRPVPATRAQTPVVNGDILKSMKIRSERKSIMLMLKESPRGRLLRLTEKRLANVSLASSFPPV